MEYTIEMSAKIEKKLLRLPKKDRTRIKEKISTLIENPRPFDSKKLVGQRTPLLYRIRAGNYRIIYSIKDHVMLILIVEVGHRKDIYDFL